MRPRRSSAWKMWSMSLTTLPLESLSAMAFCPKVLPFRQKCAAGRDGHDEAQTFALAEFKVFRTAAGRDMHDAGAFVFADIFPRDAVARSALVHLLLQLDVVEWPACNASR
jgi:hypothetical protein